MARTSGGGRGFLVSTVLLPAILLLLPAAGSPSPFPLDSPRDHEKALRAARTTDERIEVLAGIGEVDDKRLLQALFEVLEKTEWRIDIAWKRLAEIEDGLAPLRKALLSKEEWTERDKLEAEKKLAGEVLLKEESVAEKIVHLLGISESDEALQTLLRKGMRSRSPLVRVRVIEALAVRDDEAARDALLDALSDKEPQLRVRAADLLGEKKVEKALHPLIKAAAQDEVWQVRTAAIGALARIGDLRAVEPLVTIVGSSEGKVLDDAIVALEKLTGKSFGSNFLAWRDWCKENVNPEAGTILDLSGFLKPLQQSRERLTYQGIETHSLAVVFIFDFSDSMNDPASEDVIPTDGVPDRESGRRSKLDVAKNDLIQAILALDEKSRFTVILYNHQVLPWQTKMVAATRSSKNEALKFVLGTTAIGGTNIYDSLELAFNLAGYGVRDKYYKSAVDTIFLLSDGAPSEGRIIDTGQILDEVDRMNKLRKIRIHTIGIGALNDSAFLRELARRNGGKYIEKK